MAGNDYRHVDGGDHRRIALEVRIGHGGAVALKRHDRGFDDAAGHGGDAFDIVWCACRRQGRRGPQGLLQQVGLHVVDIDIEASARATISSALGNTEPTGLTDPNPGGAKQ